MKKGKRPCKHQDCDVYPDCAGCTEMEGFWDMVKEVMEERKKEGRPLSGAIVLIKEEKK